MRRKEVVARREERWMRQNSNTNLSVADLQLSPESIWWTVCIMRVWYNLVLGILMRYLDPYHAPAK
jgi:hypothetical protein